MKVKKVCFLVILTLCLTISLGLLSACSIINNQDDESWLKGSRIKIVNKPEMTIEYSSLLQNEYWSVKIKGECENISKSSLSIIMLEFSIYNENGNKIDTAYATSGSLGKGEIWEFEANSFLITQKPASFKFANATAY